MPMPERYQRQLVETMQAAEHHAVRDTRREWVRVIGEIVCWTLLGLVLIGVAFHVADVQLGWAWWWGGAIVWFGGVSTAVLSAYKRGEDRGDW